MRKVFAIGDMHLPWVNRKILRAIYLAIKREKPDIIIQLGDIYDMFSQTRFARTHNIYTPRQEADMARRMAEEFWAEIRKIAPKTKLILIKGNHDDRPYKRMLERTPEMEHFFDVRDYFTFENVETHHDSFEELFIDGVLYTHGHYSKLGAHRDYYVRSVVCGHSHTGGVVYANIHGKTIWECNAGFVADKNSQPLRYRPKKTVRWTEGYAVIDENGPRFCPL
jgi:metallophosphoesterase superfamily enzyme